MELSNGQRKFGKMLSSQNNSIAESIPNGSEVFVGKIPKEIFEDELIPIFETIGQIFDLRLMIDPMTGQSRGYAFITYFCKEHAQQAVEKVCLVYGNSILLFYFCQIIPFSLTIMKFEKENN